MAMYIKEFEEWNKVKQSINLEQKKVYIRAGEIRWCAIGVNVGSEIDGKGKSYTRPVLILHVIGAHLALVIPLTTKVKNIPGYVAFEWKGKEQALCLHQVRIISQKRLLPRKGRISADRLKAIKLQLKGFFNL